MAALSAVILAPYGAYAQQTNPYDSGVRLPPEETKPASKSDDTIVVTAPRRRIEEAGAWHADVPSVVSGTDPFSGQVTYTREWLTLPGGASFGTRVSVTPEGFVRNTPTDDNKVPRPVLIFRF